MIRRAIAAILLARLAMGGDVAAQAPGERIDINTVLMRSTFKLSGPGQSGTAFILGKPTKADPKMSYFVLVTAAHVLTKITGETATLSLRTRSDDSYRPAPLSLRIRDGTRALWTQHSSADVAVMYVGLPKSADIALVSSDLLATDETLRQYEIHPGDRLSCLGFPLSMQSNAAGFPVLRSGQIASYPLTPTNRTKTFLFDFNVFPGNSGGPVYLVDPNRMYGNSMIIGQTVQMVLGLVSEQTVVNEEIRSLSETRQVRTQLGLAVVIHASLIRETIELLPPDPKPQ